MKDLKRMNRTAMLVCACTATGALTGVLDEPAYADGPPIDRWTRTWEPAPGAWAIADLTTSGPDGEVYVVGRVDEGDGESDIAVLKYDADGDLAWAVTYNGPGAGSDSPMDVATTAEGVAIVAASQGVDGPQTVLLDYASDGALRWERRTLGENFPGFLRPQLVVGAGGQRIIAADDGNGAGSLERYAPDGERLSAVPLEFSGFGGVTALAADADLNVFVVAVNDFSRYDVMKVDPDGVVEWTYTEDDNTGLVLSEAVIDVAPGGDVVVAGSPEVLCNGDGVTVNALVWRLAPDGTVRWRHQLGPGPCGFLLVNDLTIGPDGETYVVANGALGAGTLIRIDAGGAIAWTRLASDAGLNANFDHVVVGAHGQVIVAAADRLEVPPLPVAVRAMCYDAAGKLGWTARLSGHEKERHVAAHLGAGPDGSVGLTATIRPASGPMRAIAHRLEFAACRGDLDGDDVVGFGDLLILLAAWGPSDDHPADIDGNGFVGFEDLLELLARWGPCSGNLAAGLTAVSSSHVA